MFPHPEDHAYNRFIQTLLSTQTVYTLSDDEGIAECPSTDYEGSDGEPVPVYCIWATPEDAHACKAEEWADYQVEAVPLQVLMAEWLIGMDQEEVLVGVDFDPQLYGLEIEPVELLGDLLDAAEQQGLDLEIEEYPELVNYRLEWERWAAGQTRLN